jgi:hypothetical protein
MDHKGVLCIWQQCIWKQGGTKKLVFFIRVIKILFHDKARKPHVMSQLLFASMWL